MATWRRTATFDVEADTYEQAGERLFNVLVEAVDDEHVVYVSGRRR